MKPWLCVLPLTLMTGCALMSPSYVEPAEYDLSVPENPLPEVCFELGTFRNLSGSDRRFLYRESDGKMFSDDYNRWLLSPDLMLERQFHRTLSPREGVRSGGRNSRFLQVRGTIYRCEIDRERKSAVLSVDYSIRVFVERRPVRTENLNVSTERPLRENTPAAAAFAMSECVAESIAAVRALLLEVNQNECEAK